MRISDPIKNRDYFHLELHLVPSYPVQFAKWKGGRVIGTASGAHVEQVRQLGADEVIEYRQTKFEEVARDVDVVLDTIGGETQERSWQVLKRGGVLVSVVQPPAHRKSRRPPSPGIFRSPEGERQSVGGHCRPGRKGNSESNLCN